MKLKSPPGRVDCPGIFFGEIMPEIFKSCIGCSRIKDVAKALDVIKVIFQNGFADVESHPEFKRLETILDKIKKESK